MTVEGKSLSFSVFASHIGGELFARHYVMISF